MRLKLSRVPIADYCVLIVPTRKQRPGKSKKTENGNSVKPNIFYTIANILRINMKHQKMASDIRYKCIMYVYCIQAAINVPGYIDVYCRCKKSEIALSTKRKCQNKPN